MVLTTKHIKYSVLRLSFLTVRFARIHASTLARWTHSGWEAGSADNVPTQSQPSPNLVPSEEARSKPCPESLGWPCLHERSPSQPELRPPSDLLQLFKNRCRRRAPPHRTSRNTSNMKASSTKVPLATLRRPPPGRLRRHCVQTVRRTPDLKTAHAFQLDTPLLWPLYVLNDSCETAGFDSRVFRGLVLPICMNLGERLCDVQLHNVTTPLTNVLDLPQRQPSASMERSTRTPRSILCDFNVLPRTHILESWDVT